MRAWSLVAVDVAPSSMVLQNRTFERKERNINVKPTSLCARWPLESGVGPSEGKNGCVNLSQPALKLSVEPNLKKMRSSSHFTTSNLSYKVKRPNGLSQDGFYITMAPYHLEDDLGKCPVYEVRRVGEQDGPKDEQEEPVAGVTLV
ncbi:hypothetical protein CRG98_025634 [Punica granatum]|uniref:Uncharacterized protein n=1 Tax=Punica granatum TaxID=22663 RepID=A0A2I0JCL4_PUNGR|nr:hypothetical protein CRG98_025634 [Punica granatum]